MALPPLNFRERILYKDRMDVYVQVPVYNGNPTPDIAGWTLAPATQTDSTLLQNVPCNLHLTPNVDKVGSGGLLTKIQNIDTDNLITCQAYVTLDSAYIIHATTRASAGGRDFWLKVTGEAENEVNVPCTCVYLTYYDDPVVII